MNYCSHVQNRFNRRGAFKGRCDCPSGQAVRQVTLSRLRSKSTRRQCQIFSVRSQTDHAIFAFADMFLRGLLMRRGNCRLCLKEGDLRASHLLPAAVYRMCRQESGEITDPVGIRNDPKTKPFLVYQSSRQITGNVLCSDCEQVLNVNGENWVLPQLSTLQGFPLHDKLTTVDPEIVDEDLAAYASAKVPEIQTDFLIAVSLIRKTGEIFAFSNV